MYERYFGGMGDPSGNRRRPKLAAAKKVGGRKNVGR
jgi:hypothetical protein